MAHSPVSPRQQARFAGACYVLIIILGAYAELVGRQGLVVAGDPVATLHAISAHAEQYRLGFMAEMVTNMLAIPSTVILWRLLRPTGPTLALTAMVFDLTQNTVNALNAWAQYAPLTLLPGSADGAVLSPDQLAALARLTLRWHDVGFQIGLSFFSVALLLEGYLVLRSGYFPRWLGVVFMVAGLGYLVAATDYFLALRLPLSGAPQLASLFGESAMALWLLIVGVNEAKWRAADRQA